jgi:hypothetical protein
MWGRLWGLLVVVAMVLGGGAKAGAEIYWWTDEHGIVHMTDQWAHVPASARAHVSIRQTAPPLHESTTTAAPSAPPVEPDSARQSPLQISPDLPQAPLSGIPSPSGAPYVVDSSVLIPNRQPFIHHRPKVSPPFPYNVRLDPVDQNFVWVGRNRVPKEAFTYPHVSLDTQAQFRHRVRSLEQRRSLPPVTFRTPAMRP